MHIYIARLHFIARDISDCIFVEYSVSNFGHKISIDNIWDKQETA
jgi:hypothetical protein